MPSVRLALTERVPMLAAFQYRNYRIYWSGMMVATLGQQILIVTVPWLVYSMTGSSLYLGLVSGAQGITAIVFLLIGGVLADRVNRKRLIWVTNVVFFFLVLLMAILTVTRLITVWQLVVIAALIGMVTAFDTPPRQALIPNLIDDRRHLMNAVAMHSVIWQTSRVLGPVIAGLLISSAAEEQAGEALSFFVAAGSYLAMVVAMSLIRLSEGKREGAGQSVRAALVEGVQYTTRSPAIFSVIGMVFVNSVFGISFVYLMPVFAKGILAVDSRGYGWLMFFLGVGTLCGGLVTAASAKFKSKHLMLLGASALYGLLLIAFASSRWYVLSAGLLALVGFMQQVYMVTAQTLVQWLVSEKVRGRVMGIYSLVWSLSPLGGLQAGTVANFFSAPIAVAFGGAMVTGFTIALALAVRSVRKLEIG